LVEGATAPSSDEDDVPPTNSKTSYFTSGTEDKDLEFFSSGCALVDEVLGGGYALGRTSNLVGDKSAGKTLLAMEGMANFALKYPDGAMRYAEAEDAFDERYAEALGAPVSRIEFNGKNPMATIEDWYNDLNRWMDTQKDRPGLYIVDSLDALSDDAEMKREFDEGTFGGNKPKQIGKLFRMINERMAEQRVHLMVVSQLRDKIGVTFGETKTRSGGKALDFYASQIMWLAEIGKIKRTVNGIERVVGVDVRARVKKNKVGLPFRECEYPILFGYGVDDLQAMVDWLFAVKRDELLKEIGFSKTGAKIRINNIRNKGGAEAREMRNTLRALVRQEWAKIENSFLPQSSKY
jgi:recombination protein RecA